MRVAFFGNTCNLFYQIVRALRVHSTIDAHLYLDTHHDLQMLPESDDPQLANRYPEWIHSGSFLTTGAYFSPWRSTLARELNAYDAVVVSSFGPIFGQFSGRPVVYFVAGADLTMLPFPRDFMFYYPKFQTRWGLLIKGIWQRRAIKHATEIWSQPFAPFVTALRRLGVDSSRVLPNYFPLIIDTNKFVLDPEARNSASVWIRQMLDGHDFVVFCPSRLMINSHPHLKAAGLWKNSDLLLRGFAEFVKSSGADKATLVLIERTYSPDTERAKQIIASLGIDSNVSWLVPPRPDGFTRDELVSLYSASDVVADDFGVGWFGSVVLEAAAISRPVVCYVDESAMSTLYPWHPILSTCTEDGIAEHLRNLYLHPTLREEIGCRGRKWVETFHSPENASQVYVQRFRELDKRIEHYKQLSG